MFWSLWLLFEPWLGRIIIHGGIISIDHPRLDRSIRFNVEQVDILIYFFNKLIYKMFFLISLLFFTDSTNVLSELENIDKRIGTTSLYSVQRHFKVYYLCLKGATFPGTVLYHIFLANFRRILNSPQCNGWVAQILFIHVSMFYIMLGSQTL